MAEFGENIRRAREELGITQQTLADKLFVTRQAVSRWENGSRYPDLLTAKRLAQTLDTTLDDLLADDDMHTYPEVNPVIEYPLYKRIQTALFAAAFVANLVQLLWFIFFNLTENRIFQTDYEAAWQISQAVFSGIITAILLFGLIKSIRDTINPRAAALIAVSIEGVYMLSSITHIYLAWRNYTPYSQAAVIPTLIIEAVYIAVLLIFFLSKKPLSPIPVYILAGMDMIPFTAAYITSFTELIGTAKLAKFLTTSTLQIFSILLIPTLFIYMAAVLYRKRRLSKSE